MNTKEMLIEKLRNGGQITVEDLKSLGSRKKKDPDARPAKVCSPKTAFAKAKKGQQLNKWELEELAKSPEYAVDYAYLTGKRFPECEEYLLSSDIPIPDFIPDYFFDVVKERDEAFESWMIKNENSAAIIINYCREIIKGPWKECEQTLLNIKSWRGEINLESAWEYWESFINGPWPEMEDALLNKKSKIEFRSTNVKKYFKLCRDGRREDTERTLMKSGDSYAILMYAVYCVGGKLPDGLHNKMVLGSSKSAKKYVKWLSKQKDIAVRYLMSLDGDDREKLIGMIPEETLTMG
jgi:hypothetical protein